MKSYNNSTDLSTLVDDDASAGAIARDIWAQLGRRRALIVATKIKRLADLAPAYTTVTSPKPAPNGNGLHV